MKESSNGCDRGDHVYYQHQDGTLKVGEVHAVGKDGFIVKGDGQKHRVLHKNYVGHKSRKEQTARVIDQGEDGALAQLGDGRAVFLHGYPHALEEEEPEPARKSLFLLKAGTIKNRPGLILRQGTDKSGKKDAHWVRTNKDQPKGDGHKAKEGEHVAYPATAGGGHGHGKVVSVGPGGARVQGVGGKVKKVHASRLAKGHKFDPSVHGSSSMKDEDIAKLHEHMGEPTGRESHKGVKDEDSAYASADTAMRQFQRALLGDNGVAKALHAEVFLADSAGAMKSLREHPDKPVLIIAPMKGRVRAKEKAEKDANGWAGVKDLVRGSIVVPNLDMVPKALKALKASGIKVARIKNRFANPAGAYRDMLLNMELPNGHVGELQVHIAPMIRAKDDFGGHAHYEVERSVSEREEKGGHPPITSADRAAVEHAKGHMKELYNQAWTAARKVV